MEQVSVYINKRASGVDEQIEKKIKSQLFRSELTFKNPESIFELHRELNADLVKEIDLVISIGGDGTMNTIIQRLAGTNTGLYVIPSGTANDFATMLGSTKNLNRLNASIRLDSKKSIDLIKINDKFMATNGGLGLPAMVSNEINELRKKWPVFKNVMRLTGKNIYSLFLIRKFMELDFFSATYKITSDGFNDTVTSSLILINNQPMIGGSFNVAPFTIHNDGTFNMLIFKHQNRLELISAITSIFVGKYPHNDKNIVSLELSSCRIEREDQKNDIFFGDGEVLSQSNVFEIKLYPQFLNVYYPISNQQMQNMCAKEIVLN